MDMIINKRLGSMNQNEQSVKHVYEPCPAKSHGVFKARMLSYRFSKIIVIIRISGHGFRTFVISDVITKQLILHM